MLADTYPSQTLFLSFAAGILTFGLLLDVLRLPVRAGASERTAPSLMSDLRVLEVSVLSIALSWFWTGQVIQSVGAGSLAGPGVAPGAVALLLLITLAATAGLGGVAMQVLHMAQLAGPDLRRDIARIEGAAMQDARAWPGVFLAMFPYGAATVAMLAPVALMLSSHV
ncbi:hypothetical protein [Acidimangrovimonas sediminis]|uniref:hypothetical protein n=1 Tax=Acidimangrovimonas sediminis TaxID=2056283 RepID=UPI000C801A9D|nr:hypothetical protein [Acidimangrovimonas sediminis]